MRIVLCLLLGCLMVGDLPGAVHSALWGDGGEAWRPEGRLPDFSAAGYRRGEAAIPEPEVVADVRDFGAVGDGATDDTAAFAAALAAAVDGAVLVPAGRWVIADRLRIRRPGVVLRGTGRDSVLVFPRPLQAFDPKPTRNSGGRETSSYSWSDGFLGIAGSIDLPVVTGVSAAVDRGARVIPVADPGGIEPGQRIALRIHEDDAGSMMRYLYADDPGDIDDRRQRNVVLVCRVVAVSETSVSIERPLRMALREEWRPELCRFEPTVHDAGIEHLTLEFPVTPYGGHFSELGFNGIALDRVADCWVRDVTIRHADSGVFVTGSHHCTLDGLVLESERETDGKGTTGHHGISLGQGGDHLVTGFDLRTRFIHDLTVSARTSGNVFSRGRGIDLCFDHHKWTPWANLFTDIDLGAGTRMYHHGGGKGRGRPAAAWTTFWNIRAARPQGPPPDYWCPDLVTLVGVRTDGHSRLEPDGLWFETIAPDRLAPGDLHRAMVERRRSSP